MGGDTAIGGDLERVREVAKNSGCRGWKRLGSQTLSVASSFVLIGCDQSEVVLLSIVRPSSLVCVP